MTGAELIAAERQRQIDEENWTPEHDELHRSPALALAAASYAVPLGLRDLSRRLRPDGNRWEWLPTLWPWSPEWWKPTPNDRVRELVKAGALIAAEIDRLEKLDKR